MKRIIVFLAISIVLISHKGFTQDYAFRVLANKGLNKVKTG
ncbi:hypothetical protein MNBD_BACTEROID06-1840, partial [hydrothermal vent metagenome]